MDHTELEGEYLGRGWFSLSGKGEQGELSQHPTDITMKAYVMKDSLC